MEEKDWLQRMSEENQIQKVLQMNPFTGAFGLTLSEEDARLLVQEREINLKEQQRVEFGEGVLAKLAAGQAYRLGCERVREKVRAAKQAYKELLERAADAVIERGWEMPQELGGYLKRDIPDFVTELRLAAENHCVPKIVVV